MWFSAESACGNPIEGHDLFDDEARVSSDATSRTESMINLIVSLNNKVYFFEQTF